MGEEEAEKHVCCECSKKTKKRHKIVEFLRFRRKGEVEEEVKENVEATTVEKESTKEAAGGDIVKRAEKKGSSFFWNMKRESADVSAEKTTEQATKELNGKTSLKMAEEKTEEKTSKTEEKTATSFFWNTKREPAGVSSEKSTKQRTEEELNEDTKTIDLATEVIKKLKKLLEKKKMMTMFRLAQFPVRVPGSGRQVLANPAIGREAEHLSKSALRF